MFEKQEETKTANDIRLLKCRTCLQELGANSIGLDLFQHWVQPLEGIESTIADDLAKLTNIQINQTDKYPKVICEFCCLKLKNACDFVSLVRKNDCILRKSNIDYCNKTICPKPIQIDKNVNKVVYENVTDIKIKQELCECTGDKRESCGCNDLTKYEIKIEPEEFIQEKSSDIEMTDSVQTTQAKCDKIIESQNDQNKSNLIFLSDRIENKAAVAERSRLYRERHRKEINQRRRERRRHQQKLHQINSASIHDESMDSIEQCTAETNKKVNSQTRRQRRYYQRNREIINQRRRDQRRKKQCKQKSQEIHVESNGQYRENNRSNNKPHT